MMAGFMSYFGGRRDPKQSSRDAIVTLRQQLQMIEKKGEYLQKKIDEETKTARANAVTNKTGASGMHVWRLSPVLRGVGVCDSGDRGIEEAEGDRTGAR